MSETLFISILTIGAGLIGAALKAIFDAATHRRDTLWAQLQAAQTRLDALDKRQDDLLMRNGELQARVAALKSELEHERERNKRLEGEIGELRAENVLLRSAMRARGIPVEDMPFTRHEED